jgi:hypothetical protein
MGGVNGRRGDAVGQDRPGARGQAQPGARCRRAPKARGGAARGGRRPPCGWGPCASERERAKKAAGLGRFNCPIGPVQPVWLGFFFVFFFFSIEIQINIFLNISKKS